MKLEFSWQAFEKRNSDIKFNQNSSSGSRDVPYGRTDMTKLIVDFRNFANAPKNGGYENLIHSCRHVFTGSVCDSEWALCYLLTLVADNLYILLSIACHCSREPFIDVSRMFPAYYFSGSPLAPVGLFRFAVGSAAIPFVLFASSHISL